jgi:predicted alpha-1,2-mannosidase
LDELFRTKTFDQGNEPSHHIPYLYDFAGAPAKTQEHVRRIMSDYTDAPDGLIGNDDAGQMSAWFVFSSLGFYPVTPGSDRYEIGSPLFDEATLHLPGGRSLHIVAHGASAGGRFIRSVTLNGIPIRRPWLLHKELTAGGELRFTMSNAPSHEWPNSM